MHFRLYQPGDFVSLYAIEEQCFVPPLRFSRQYMRQLIDSPDAATWVAEDEESLSGFAIVEWSYQRARRVAYIQTIEVAPAFRRRGIGRQLLRLLEASAEAASAVQICLHVDAENDPALRLYRAEGYQLRGRQEHYYARSRAAEIYVKPLAPQSSRADGQAGTGQTPPSVPHP